MEVPQFIEVKTDPEGDIFKLDLDTYRQSRLLRDLTTDLPVTSPITLPNIRTSIFRLIYSYLIKPRGWPIEKSISVLPEILIAAQYLQIEELEKICSQYILSSISNCQKPEQIRQLLYGS